LILTLWYEPSLRHGHVGAPDIRIERERQRFPIDLVAALEVEHGVGLDADQVAVFLDLASPGEVPRIRAHIRLVLPDTTVTAATAPAIERRLRDKIKTARMRVADLHTGAPKVDEIDRILV